MAQAAPALQAYTAALTLDPAYSQAYFLRGQTHFGVGDMPAALDDFLAAVRHDPQAKDARHMAVPALPSVHSYR